MTEMSSAIRVDPHQGMRHISSLRGLGGMSVRTEKIR